VILLLSLYGLEKAQGNAILFKLAQVGGLLVAADSETALVPVHDAEGALDETCLLVAHRPLSCLHL